MTILLTEDERAKVEANALDPRPSYFNASLDMQVLISEDFEAFIILAPQATRDSVLNWVQRNRDQSALNSARDDLLTECLQGDLDASQSQLDELDGTLQEFDEFRSRFQDSNTPTDSTPQVQSKLSRFSGVPEVGLMLDDLQASISELRMARDRAKHQNSLTQVLQAILATNSLSASQRQESDSWAGPFTAYDNME